MILLKLPLLWSEKWIYLFFFFLTFLFILYFLFLLQAVMRHYIGKKHGILDKYVKEELNIIRRENGGRIPGTMGRPGIELML